MIQKSNSDMCQFLEGKTSWNFVTVIESHSDEDSGFLVTSGNMQSSVCPIDEASNMIMVLSVGNPKWLTCRILDCGNVCARSRQSQASGQFWSQDAASSVLWCRSPCRSAPQKAYRYGLEVIKLLRCFVQ